MTSAPILGGVHHAAYRCHDAARTAAWYEAMLGMTFTTAFAKVGFAGDFGQPDLFE